MHATGRVLLASALATLGLTAAVATPAQADAPAPSCESGASEFYCDGVSTGTTFWTVTWYSGSVGTFKTAGSVLLGACPAANIGRQVQVSYRYVAGGETQYSDTGAFICRSGPWQ
ncbi:hypothetical protein [Micromonospora okii]|uniref:hypothetical protein n=1 Tax=Micromonospora okii TaxID=1182970 RepID=UPI001E64CFC2|nr:hypothetical protein [Micromonospora okii]